DAGSDVRSMQTVVRRDGNSFVINGTKTWISNADLADFYIVFCRYPEGGERSYIALLVQAKSQGLAIHRFDVISPHPIGTLDFQITQAKLADMALAIDASALLVYRAAWTHDVLKQPVTREAAMAKLHATESAQRVIDEAVQILGGQGVLAGSVTEQLYREVRA